MLLEVEKLRQTPRGRLGLVDAMRRSKILAFAVMFYCLIIQRGILDGGPAGITLP